MDIVIILKNTVLLFFDIISTLINVCVESILFLVKGIFFDFVNWYNRINFQLGTPEHMIFKHLMERDE